jgi:uncharacterized protein YciI
MWFAITAADVPDSLEKRMATRPAHLERLQKLQDEGRLLVAGAFPAIESEDPGPAGFTGSLILAQFPSQADAEAWAKAGPFVAAGVYASVTVKPFRKAVLAG